MLMRAGTTRDGMLEVHCVKANSFLDAALSALMLPVLWAWIIFWGVVNWLWQVREALKKHGRRRDRAL